MYGSNAAYPNTREFEMLRGAIACRLKAAKAAERSSLSAHLVDKLGLTKSRLGRWLAHMPEPGGFCARC